MKYLMLCKRHESLHGDHIALWWGSYDRRKPEHNQSGYTSDLRAAHLFTKEEAMKIQDRDDIAVPISSLGFTENEMNSMPENKHLRIMIEKGTLVNRCGLDLRKPTPIE